MEPLFRPVDQVQAFDFLAQEAGDKTVVLSAYDSGNAIPAWAPVFVVMGHRPETSGFPEIEPRVMAFYQDGISDGERLELLNEFSVDFVFWGPEEREYGNWNPSTSPNLESVFREGEYEIFEVILP